MNLQDNIFPASAGHATIGLTKQEWMSTMILQGLLSNYTPKTKDFEDALISVAMDLTRALAKELENEEGR